MTQSPVSGRGHQRAKCRPRDDTALSLPACVDPRPIPEPLLSFFRRGLSRSRGLHLPSLRQVTTHFCDGLYPATITFGQVQEVELVSWHI